MVGSDAIRLRNSAVLLDRLCEGGVAQLISCHVHRTTFGNAIGVPLAVFKSCYHQIPMHLDDHSASVSVDEPGAYGTLLLQPDGVIVNIEDFALASGTPQASHM